MGWDETRFFESRFEIWYGGRGIKVKSLVYVDKFMRVGWDEIFLGVGWDEILRVGWHRVFRVPSRVQDPYPDPKSWIRTR